MANYDLNIISNFATTNTPLNLIHCIEEFESGRDNIYILDDEGKYTGFAVTKRSFRKIWNSVDDSFVNVLGINEQLENQEILKQTLEIFSKRPNLTEVPLLKNNRVTAVITRLKQKEIHKFNWNNIVDNTLLPEVRNYKKIYLSSLENQDILNFYNCWSTRLPLIPLSNNNLMNSIEDENTLLIYAEDLFPNHSNKISIFDFWNKLVTHALKRMTNFCYISSEFATVKQSEAHNLALFIQKFDKGFHCVNIVDKDNKLIEVVLRSNFNEDFPKKHFRRQTNLYIDYSENEDAIKWNIAQCCFGTTKREVPIIREGKVIASGRFGKVTILDSASALSLQNREGLFPPIYWELIDNDLIEEFFGEHKKILISSEYGNLIGFRERFNDILDITVYDDSMLEKYLSGEFDMLIYEANIWPETSTIKYSAREIFDTLLNETLRRYLQRNHIHYYCRIKNINSKETILHKIKHTDIEKKPTIILNKIYNDYLIHSDIRSNDWNSINGIRHTVGNPDYYERTIYIFGPCVAAGTFVKDSLTVESILQKIINQNNIPCRVVNCGTFGTTVTNSLYRIMDNHFNEGDIIVNMSVNYSWNNESIFKDFHINDIFDQSCLKYCKTFVDRGGLGHLNSDGTRVVAEFLWNKLHGILEEKLEQPKQIVKSMFSQYNSSLRRLNMNEDLVLYLDSLKKELVESKNIGAIVMNCNPFTRGHRYLIEQALKSVDFLYVFVVEEDSSDFSFKDRFAIVKANCADLKNVKVLPSGKYMISSMTFADYFQKDDLQGQQTMIPSMDIQLFAQAISPTLNINKRFVGEEPLDTVTRQYNQAMKDILPSYGVELIEIPRLQLNDGEPINATKVRKLILDGDLKSCEKYLTTETYLYIKKNFKRICKMLKER